MARFSLLLLAVGALSAQRPGYVPLPKDAHPNRSAMYMPEQIRNVGIDQKLSNQVALDTVFRDEAGRAVTLRQLMKGRPVVLSLVYYECPMLCNMVLNGQLRAFRALPTMTVGKEFDVISVSFDAREKPELAAAKKKPYLEKYQRAGAQSGWHFLTGDEESIRRLARDVGFRFQWEPQNGQFVHASGIMILTPQGKVSRYLLGVEYSARDLKFALIEASAHKIGSAVDQLLLYCFHYDPSTGKYGVAIMTIVRAAGAATVLTIAGFLFVMIRRERRAVKGVLA